MNGKKEKRKEQEDERKKRKAVVQVGKGPDVLPRYIGAMDCGSKATIR
jgi:hypothetical protein